MNEQEKVQGNQTETPKEGKKRSRRNARKTQSQMIQEALGMNPTDIADVEDKLFITRFLDYFADEPLDFVFKEKNVSKYIDKLNETISKLQQGNEEDKLLCMNYEEKRIVSLIQDIINRTENIAVDRGFKTSADKRLRRLSLYTTIPMLALVAIFAFLPGISYYILFPILCVFCMLPQLLRGSVLRKWTRFKEENRTEVYTQNREDVMVLKSFVGDVLNNIRTKLIELKVPLQLIKFVLHSSGYENLKLIDQKAFRGVTQYYYTFAYPEGMEPLPLPENLRTLDTSNTSKESEPPEQNFIVLSELKAENGIITSFVPSLRDKLAGDINAMLNESEFENAPMDFTKIIPNYGENLAIYCKCGELSEIVNVQECTWKNEFKYYLFEGVRCNCGEKVYALSLMDSNEVIPEKLQHIFSS
jgi:hypothetical protein